MFQQFNSRLKLFKFSLFDRLSMLLNKDMIFLVLVTHVMLVVSDTKGKNFHNFVMIVGVQSTDFHKFMFFYDLG